MKNLLAPTAQASVQFFLYRYRFLFVYILIGFASLCVEVILLRALNYLGLELVPASLLGLASGIFFAYWMNVRFNFKVPVAKRNRALGYFAGISLLSAGINFSFKRQLVDSGWSYEEARFGVSAALFSFAYLLHRRFSFVDRKQVGVAVYANGVEDIRSIREKIGDYPDFIHVDVIDASFGAADTAVQTYRLETIRAYWPRRRIHVHLMSAHPRKWLADVLPHADVIVLHRETDEDLHQLFAEIHAAGRQAGLALTMATPLSAAEAYLPKVSVVMLLTIAQPGRSGQELQLEALDRIESIKRWPGRARFQLCVDGGVTEKNVHLLNVELVVSGSSVLTAAHPAQQIMRLQTSNNHEAV